MSLRITVLALLLITQIAYAQKGQTLGEVKHAYVNQRVVIKDTITESGLLEWRFAEHPDTLDGRPDFERRVPNSLLGQKGLVLAVVLTGPSAVPDTKTNAFGEVISADDKENPYVAIIVKTDGGETIVTTAFPTIISGVLTLESTKKTVDEYIESNLAATVGRKVYAVGWSTLYDADSTLDELVGLTTRRTKRVIGFSRLEPLTITAAKYFSTPEVALFKLKSETGASYIIVGSSNGEPLDTTKQLISTLNLSVYSEVPSSLTPKEIAAIKAGSIFRGESKDALEFTLGFPEKENDWGLGGKQLVYSTMMIYIDNRDILTDWQEIDSR